MEETDLDNENATAQSRSEARFGSSCEGVKTLERGFDTVDIDTHCDIFFPRMCAYMCMYARLRERERERLVPVDGVNYGG